MVSRWTAAASSARNKRRRGGSAIKRSDRGKKAGMANGIGENENQQ